MRALIVGEIQSLGHTIQVESPATTLIGRFHLMATTPAPASGSGEVAPVSAEVREHAEQQVAWALQTVEDGSELQSVVNTLAYILETAGNNRVGIDPSKDSSD